MSEWVDKCEAALQQIQTDTGVPYDFERFSCDADQLPDEFMVYFLVDDPGLGHSDNVETSHEPRIEVSYFYRDVAKIATMPDKIEAAFLLAGGARGPAGTIPYQADTGHYGWRRDFYFYERR